jgi:hypothetical protein
MEPKQQTFSIWYFIGTLVIIFMMQMYLPMERTEVVSYSQFKSLVKHGAVSDLVLSDTTIRGKIQPAGMRDIFPEEKLKELKYDGKSPYGITTVRVNDPELTTELERAGISFKGEVGGNRLPTILSWVVPIVLFVVVWTYLMKRMGGGAAGSARSWTGFRLKDCCGSATTEAEKTRRKFSHPGRNLPEPKTSPRVMKEIKISSRRGNRFQPRNRTPGKFMSPFPADDKTYAGQGHSCA